MRKNLKGCRVLTWAALLLLGTASGAQTLPPSVNVHYVDSFGSNFLFRGGTPCSGSSPAAVQFEYDVLKKALADAARQAGVNLPSDYAILDVTLLWIEEIPVSEQVLLEREHIFKEDSFFKTNPSLGKIQMWPTRGTSVSPRDRSLEGYRDFLAQHLDDWLREPLVSRVDRLRLWLIDPSEIGLTSPVVIYVHCYGGCDRTGELIGSYALRYQNRSWEEMNALNRKACRGGYMLEQCNALRWYGLRLNLDFGWTLHWDSPDNCANWLTHLPLVMGGD